MGRVINTNTGTKDFPPLVGIREKGNYVKGKVLEVGKTANNNPVVTLELIDLDGNTSKSTTKGVYEEVDVKVGDTVQLIGSSKATRDAIPQLNVGDVVTFRFDGKIKQKNGRMYNQFHIEVD